jgi:hypothetical protein
MLFEFLTPEYLKTKLDLIDLSITGLRDAIRGTGNKTLTDLDTDLANIYNRLDVALSTRASEATLAGIKSKTDLLTFDTNNYLRVNVSTTVNPPNLDVALSTRASESTLSALSNKFPSAVTLADNLSNPTTTIIGVANLGWDGTYWRRVAVDTSSRFKIALDADNVGLLKDTKIPNPLGVLTNLDVIGTTTNALAVISQTLPARQPYTIQNISVTTTEGSTSISAPGAKILIIKNKGDVDVMIGINGAVPTTNPLIVRARTIKMFPHKGITQVNYKVASGSSTIDLEYYN